MASSGVSFSFKLTDAVDKNKSKLFALSTELWDPYENTKDNFNVSENGTILGCVYNFLFCFTVRNHFDYKPFYKIKSVFQRQLHLLQHQMKVDESFIPD